MGAYEQLVAALEEFIVTDNPAVWESRVRPLLKKVVESKLYGTTRMAILRETGLVLTDAAGRNVFLTAAELQAVRLAKNAAGRALVRRQILGALGFVAPYVFCAIFVFTTAQDGYALSQTLSSDNQKAYTEYMNKYIQYVARTAEVGHYIERFPPPMTYEKWLNKDKNVAWWQEN